MTSGLEFDGKNVEIAIKKACDKLKIKEEKLKYDVISYGSTGIFGLVGTKKAKIRVTSPKHLKTIMYEESDNSIDNQNIMKETEMADIASIVEESFADNKVDSVHGNSVGDADSEHVETSNDETPQENANKQDSEKDEPSAIIAGEEVLEKIVELITNDAEISVQQENKKVKYNVRGGNTAVLIGKKGQTLEAIQYIVEKIVNKKSLGKNQGSC
jgi:spoIIIJ-associated protein